MNKKNKIIVTSLLWILLVSIAAPYSCYGSTSIIPNFYEVNPRLYRGGKLKEKDITVLKQIGIKTIIDLEYKFFYNQLGGINKEQKWCNKVNIKYVHAPMSFTKIPKEKDVDMVLTLLEEPTSQPVYIHCRQGRDRTGFIIGMYRTKYEGWTPQKAYEEMVKLGFHHYQLFGWKNAFFRYASSNIG